VAALELLGEEPMKTEPESELARICEARIRISEQFNHDPELMVRHYMEQQERHGDRLVHSREAAVQELTREM
jgi:hypothetical protein